ncbi:MAG: signal peptide peptidase SppA [Desulfobacterales bacterium]|nr:MAG: signal peptide peptidase SppA [Desulfobacterales bacterium]
MFARRHPFLFFLSIVCGCLTVSVLGLAGVMLAGSLLFNSSLTPGAIRQAGGNIGVVEVIGPIMSSKRVIEDIQAFRKDDRIKAIVLRIDSPGGGIGPSQEIYREVIKTGEEKRIIASMGSVAASGGYYIASAAQGIVANPGTITGSIGVIMEYANLKAIAEKIGISPVVIKSGEFKDMGSPMRALKKNEKALFQQLVDELHQQFVADAAAARHMDKTVMAKLADGRVYTGQKALTLKLIDRLGNLDDAIQWAGRLAEIEGDLVPVYPAEDKMTFIKKLADTLLKDINISGMFPQNPGYSIK